MGLRREEEQDGSAVWSKLKTDKPAMSRRAAFIYVTMSVPTRRAAAAGALRAVALIGELFTRSFALPLRHRHRHPPPPPTPSGLLCDERRYLTRQNLGNAGQRDVA